LLRLLARAGSERDGARSCQDWTRENPELHAAAPCAEKHDILTDRLRQRARATGKQTVKKRHDEWLKRCPAAAALVG
jgi:hypothetical protein